VSGESAPGLLESGDFPKTLILTLLFASSNPLSFCRSCESRIDHHVVYRVSRLGDDKLNVNRWLVTI
jgi:hypothetical protein